MSAQYGPIADLLPAGSTYDLDLRTSWPQLGPNGYAMPVRLPDGKRDLVALVMQPAGTGTKPRDATGSEAPARLVWRLSDAVDQPLEPDSAIVSVRWPGKKATAAGVNAADDRGVVIVTFAPSEQGATVETTTLFPLGDAANRGADLALGIVPLDPDAGDGPVAVGVTATRWDGDHRWLNVYGPVSEGVAPLIGTFGADAVLRDMDGDGRIDVVARGNAGGYDVWHGTPSGLRRGEHTADRPRPPKVVDGRLPELPADLYLLRDGGPSDFEPETRGVWRWPASGGRLEIVGPPEDASSPTLRLAGRDGAGGLGRAFAVARDAPVVVYELADDASPRRPVALGFQDLEAGTWVTVPISETLTEWRVAPDGRSVLYVGDGESGLVHRGRPGLYVVRPGSEPTMVAPCEVSALIDRAIVTSSCAGLTANDDWTMAAFRDVEGIKVVPIAGGEPELVLADVESGRGEQWMFPVSFVDSALLMTAQTTEGSSVVLLDLGSNKLVDLVTAERGSKLAEVALDTDASRVAVARLSSGGPPFSTVNLDTMERLEVLTDHVTEDTAGGLVQSWPSDGLAAFAPTFLHDGRLRFGLWRPWARSYWSDGVFEASPEGRIRQIASGLAGVIPADTSYEGVVPFMAWAPEADGFVMAARRGDGRWLGVVVGAGEEGYDATELLAPMSDPQWSRPRER